MSFLEAILLGVVQGVTEFLPVSSSGHIAVLNNMLHTNNETGLLFEIMLHIGTMATVIFTFRSDIKRMFWEALRMISDLVYNLKAWMHNKVHETDDRLYKKILHNNYRKLIVMILVSSIPTGIMGFLLRGIVQQMNLSLLACGSGMLITAVILIVVDYWNYGDKIPKDIKVKEALLIGTCQGIGVLPGISRLGITVTAGLLCGFRRSFAVKYSYLLSIPAILGAMLLEIREFHVPSMNFHLGAAYTLGMLAAALSGFLCIRFLMSLINKKKFKYFAIYCGCIGIVSLVCNFILPLQQ